MLKIISIQYAIFNKYFSLRNSCLNIWMKQIFILSYQNEKIQDSTPENLLASISESVRQGLNIMDEKYKVMDVACSDSEEEEEGDAVVFRLVFLVVFLSPYTIFASY